jgi:hypothetical protein
MKYLLLVILTIITISGCKKETDFKIDASGITYVDENGDPTGVADPTDWRFDDEWNDKEVALFNFGDTVSTLGMQPASSLSALVQPNPADSVFYLTFMANRNTLLKWVITDEYLNVVSRKVVRLENSYNLNPNIGFAMDVRSSKYKKSGYYRVYYAFYYQGGILYKKGHGDFKKQ